MHIVGSPQPQIPTHGEKTLLSVHNWLNMWMQNPEIGRASCLFTEKTPASISGPAQYKPVVFKGQLYKQLPHCKEYILILKSISAQCMEP